MIELFEHQKKGVETARSNSRFALFWQPGTGKTMTVLSIQKERPMRTLVVATKSILWSAWEKDAELMEVPLVVACHHNKRKRLEMIEAPGDHIIATNYEQFRIHIKDFVKSGVQRVVFDESSKLKNRKAKTTKAAIEMADVCREVYLLSGSPAPNCRTELWSQLRCLSEKAAGASFFKWAYYWFIPVMRQAAGRSVVDRWLMKPEREEAFQQHLKEWSWALRKEECLDLPEQMDQIIKVELTKEERKTYNEVANELRLSLPDGFTDRNLMESTKIPIAVEAVLMKLRQVVGGSVKANGSIAEIGSSKLDALTECLDEIGNEPVVIWAEFRADIDRIARRLTQRGETVAIIDGRSSSKARDIVNQFVNGEVSRLILHPKAAGHGTDGLQKVCRYAVYFSLSFSADEHIQSRDRIHRSGQHHPCTYLYLLGEDTVDESMFHIVRRKQSKQTALLRDLKAT